ncbi:nucleoside/nucleotide kinase family protein [Arthrobacter castelli]|uniref:nucleoside/nucleotide kinase family protein n=1 Tax=Arthrobacter castelli TaxID=271431 RepID=UPI00041480FC|nr:nucleoside/nucleotide kinase family protein [Arthrobacter castelli]
MPETAEAVTFEQLLELAAALVVPGQRRILGITGAPGAGKSQLAGLLVSSLPPGEATCVAMDGFHLSNEILTVRGLRHRKGAIETFDDGGYAALLHRVRRQQAGDAAIYAPLFRRDMEESIASALPVEADTPLVITEGNYLLQDGGAWPEARRAMDVTWYLDTDDELRRERLLDRHVAYGKTRQEAHAWTNGSDQENARLIAASAFRADRRFRVA